MADKSDALKEALEKLKADHDDTLEELESAKADIEALTAERDEALEKLKAASASRKSENGGQTEELIEKTVLKTYGYRKIGKDGKVEIALTTVEPGETVLVTPEQAAHGERFGALGSREQYEQISVTGPQPESDEEIQARNSVELLSYLNQHSEDDELLVRIEMLEEDRPTGSRPEILEAIEKIRSAKDQ